MGNKLSLILTDKKEGETSFRSLSSVKREFRGEKVGHAGTLDKFASGLMIVLVGSATKLNPVFSSYDKTYLATIQFGKETDTLDPEGTVIRETPFPERENLKSVLERFIGRSKQVPPVYSAIHVDGKRAYREARKGNDVIIPEREINVSSLDLIDYDEKNGMAVIRTRVSKGTYIRALARDIANKASSSGHLVQLRRESIGPFTLFDIGKNTEELLDKTGLFSQIEMNSKFRKEIDNGYITNNMILSDTDKNRPFAYMYFDNCFYGIAEKGERPRVLVRCDGSL